MAHDPPPPSAATVPVRNSYPWAATGSPIMYWAAVCTRLARGHLPAGRAAPRRTATRRRFLDVAGADLAARFRAGVRAFERPIDVPQEAG